MIITFAFAFVKQSSILKLHKRRNDNENDQMKKQHLV